MRFFNGVKAAENKKGGESFMGTEVTEVVERKTPLYDLSLIHISAAYKTILESVNNAK